MNGGARRKMAVTAVVAVLATSLVACGDDDSSSTATPRRTPSPSDTQASDTTPTDEPTTGVGPRTEALRGADILVFSKETLTDDMIKRIRKVKGVRSVEPMSMAQVSIENRVINIAAVDPATYRNYTPESSANLQEEWERVAAGQLAIVERLKKRLPRQRGLLQLGGATDAPQVPIGAFAEQIPSVDAVVNEQLGDELGMQPRNALIVATYPRRAPEAVRKPIERIAGDSASVQRLDIAARLGLDTSVQQTAYLVGTVGDAVGVYNYTVLPRGHLIRPEPSWVQAHIATEVVPILGAVTCNKLIFPQLRAALQEIVDIGLADEIHPNEYQGCYYPRFIAGTTKLSNHAFGLALDLNVPGNQRGTVGEMDRVVVAVFEKWGFTWGGRWRYTDPMHFEANAIVNPG
ncbi:MAG: M15 family metallopeptidase [Nocardioides sp.]